MKQNKSQTLNLLSLPILPQGHIAAQVLYFCQISTLPYWPPVKSTTHTQVRSNPQQEIGCHACLYIFRCVSIIVALEFKTYIFFFKFQRFHIGWTDN